MAETRVERVGIYSAYRFAVEGGYTGTEEEFEAGLATSANYASNAQASAESASASATSASTYASNASASASNASESATAAATAQASAETAQEAAEAAAQQAEETLDEYAKVDGFYEDMTVGNAEQLISSVYVEDSEAYKYRTSGGSADIGNREYDEIVGGTVAWNQLFISPSTKTIKGITFTRIDNGHLEISGTADGTGTIYQSVAARSLSGHVYYVDKGTSDQQVRLYNDGSGVSTGYVERSVVGKATEDKSFNLSLPLTATFANAISLAPQIIDLTQMFGTTIADYIYSLEQANEGAGVAFFRKLFPNDYYEYNAGELISVSGLSSHDTVGFNQWDEITELGSISSATGGNSSSSTQIRTKNYIPVLPNTTYYLKTPYNLGVARYKKDKSFISLNLGVKNSAYTTPDDCYYLRFYCVPDYGTTYNNDICINLSWSGSRNGDYEEYVKHSYVLDDSLTLRGIPKLSDGKLTFDGDVYASDGTVTRKYGIVDLGTLTWNGGSDSKFYTSVALSPAYVAPKTASKKDANIFCSKYAYGGGAGTATSGYDKVICYDWNNIGKLIVFDSAYTDTASFTAAMSGVYLIYELATPTTETAEPFQSPQIVDDYGTEEYISTTIVPVGHNTKYMANSVDKLNHLPTLADSDGDYVIRQSGTQMSLIPMTQVKELPDAPSTDGTYTLKVTVTDGEATYSWGN